MKIDGYKFGQKNNWRRWNWNRITERLSVPTRDAIVLYLAGKEDLDRHIAVSHGFRPENLIAIDRNSAVIELLKKKNTLAIKCDVYKFIRTMKYRKAFDVFVLDLCCGLTKYVQNLMFEIAILKHDSVISLNLLRGRESDNYYKEWASFTNGADIVHKEEFRKHRAINATAVMERFIISMLRYKYKTFGDESLRRVLEYINHNDALVYNSYNSGNQVFDSVVFKAVNMFREYINEEKENGLTFDSKIVNKFNALMAIRTMRINRQLEPCPIF